MDEFVVTDVDTYMVDIPFALLGGVEEDKIARFEVLSAYVLAVFGLFNGSAGYLDAVFLADIRGKAGTVEGVLLSCRTPYISSSQLFLGDRDKFFPFDA